MTVTSGIFRAASVAFFVVLSSVAIAQNAGTVTSHAFAVGKGPGTQGFTSVSCALAQIAVGQTSADPICRTLTGDVTLTAAGVTAIGANKVTNAQVRQSAALSLIGRSANTLGNVADIQATAGSSCAFVETSSTIACAQLQTAGLANNAVTNAKLATAGAATLKGNPTGSTANEQDVTLDSTLAFSGTTLKATTATASQLGVVKPDGTTITVSGGTLTAVGAAATSIGVGTTTIASGTAGAVLYNNGGVLGNELPGTPYFKVHQANSQSLSSSMAKITFDTVDLNAGSAWSATNHNFNPQVAGTYEICVFVDVTGTFVASNAALIDISKNGMPGSGGTLQNEFVGESQGSTSLLSSIGGCTLVAMNGTTDTVEVDVSSTGTTVTTNIANNRVFFAGHLVGP